MKNIGTGSTRASSWFDQVFIHDNDTRGIYRRHIFTVHRSCLLQKHFINSQQLLASSRAHCCIVCLLAAPDEGTSLAFTRRSFNRALFESATLAPGEEYSVSSRVQTDNRISGDYYIHVVTDVFDNVYEHTSEQDNTGVSEVSAVLFMTRYCYKQIVAIPCVLRGD